MFETPPPIDSRTAALTTLAVVLVATIALGERRRLGPHADWVEVVRATIHPVFDPVLDRVLGGPGAAYELTDQEYVGRVPVSPEAVEHVLWELGARRNTLSAYKTLPDGRGQVGAWVYRGDGVADDRQVDMMLFAAPDDEMGTDVYAHEEYSSAVRWLLEDPMVLVRHYRGVEYSPRRGIEHVVGLTWGEFGGDFELSDRALDVLADLPERDASTTE